MDNEALKAAAKKELLRRQAMAELARRQQAAQAPSQVKGDTLADTAMLLTPMGQAKEIYRAVTDPSAALQRVDDSVRNIANGLTFGYADKFAAKMGGTDLAEERGKSASAQDRMGTTGVAQQIAASALPATRAAELGLTATRIPGWVGKYGGLILDGMGYGALDAAGHDRSIAEGAGMGGVFGAAGQAVKSGGEKLYSLLGRTPEAPSLEQLKAAKDAKYRAVDTAGEQFSPEQVQTLATGIGDDLAASGIDPVLNPMPYRFSQVISDRAQSPMSLRELDKIDSKIGRKLLTSTDGEDRYLGGLMRDNISEFMDANGGTGLIGEARTAYKKYRNLERVMGAADKAERRAASSGSGGNEDNAIRQNIRGILDNPKVAKFYSKEERAAMEKVVRGTKGQNLARRVGKMSPENGGLMAGLMTLGSVLNPVVGVPAAAGFVSKRIADQATRKNLDELMYLLAAGEKMPVRKMSPNARRALDTGVRAGTVGLLGLAAQ